MEKIQAKQIQSTEQFALLGLTSNVPISDSVALAIPFDDILTQSGSVGTIVNPPVFDLSFQMDRGLYLVQLQIFLDFQPTAIQVDLLCQSGGAADQNSLVALGSAGAINSTLSALRASSEPPIGPPFTSPCAIGARVTVTGGSGNVASGTQMLVLPISVPAP